MAETIDLGKDSGRRSDFSGQFDLKVRQKGFRAYWSRAVLCSCQLNSVTRHADPSCPSCDGDGWYYVLPDEAPSLKANEDAGFTDLSNAKATRCLVTSMSKNMEIYENFGEWIMGSVRVTTFSFHKFSYRDRFTLVDGLSEYQQVMEIPASRTITVGRKDPRDFLRYPIINLRHVLEIQSDGTRLEHRTGVTCNSDGSITFPANASSTSTEGNPATGSLVTVVYDYHPVLIIMENVIDTRLSYSKFKSPTESTQFFPRFVLAKPDFMPDEATGKPSDAPP